MKRFACHILVLPNGEYLSMQVIELSEEGYLIKHYTFEEEQPATEWVGGVCILLPESVTPSEGANLKALLSQDVMMKSDIRLRFWRAVGLGTNDIFSATPERWLLL